MTEIESATIGGKQCKWTKWPAYTGAAEFRKLAHVIGKDVLGSLLGADDPEIELIAKGEFNTVARVLTDLIDSACGEGKIKRKLEILAQHTGILPEHVDALVDPLYPHDGFEEWALHWVTLAEAEVEGHAIKDAVTADKSPLSSFELLQLGWRVFKAEAGPLFEALASWTEQRRKGSETTSASSPSAATD